MDGEQQVLCRSRFLYIQLILKALFFAQSVGVMLFSSSTGEFAIRLPTKLTILLTPIL
jgi:hypothetical protein